jgi:maltose O-acetyltransferase
VFRSFFRNRDQSSRAWNLLVNVVAAGPLVGYALRSRVYSLCGMGLETRDIRRGCYFFGPDIRVGPDSMINHRCYFENRGRITIGARCFLGMEVALVTSSHSLGPHTQRAGPILAAPISIGDGCWIGARATVLPGVSIGAGCVIAAGAVVAHHCESDGLYAGVPARRIRDLRLDGSPPTAESHPGR